MLMVAAAGLIYVEFYASTHESQASNVVRLERPRYRTVPFHLRDDNSTALDWQEQRYSEWSLTLKRALDAIVSGEGEAREQSPSLMITLIDFPAAEVLLPLLLESLRLLPARLDQRLLVVAMDAQTFDLCAAKHTHCLQQNVTAGRPQRRGFRQGMDTTDRPGKGKRTKVGIKQRAKAGRTRLRGGALPADGDAAMQRPRVEGLLVDTRVADEGSTSGADAAMLATDVGGSMSLRRLLEGDDVPPGRLTDGGRPKRRPARRRAGEEGDGGALGAGARPHERSAQAEEGSSARGHSMARSRSSTFHAGRRKRKAAAAAKQALKAQSTADGDSGGSAVGPVHRRASVLIDPSAEAAIRGVDEKATTARLRSGFGNEVRRPLQPLDNSTYPIEGAAAKTLDKVAHSITTAAAMVQTDAELGAVLDKEDGLILGHYEEVGGEEDVRILSQERRRMLLEDGTGTVNEEHALVALQKPRTSALGWERVTLMQDVTLLGYDALYVEPDIVFLSDPFPVVRQRRSDILCAAAIDGDETALRDAEAPAVSLGLLYVRATPLAKAVLRDWHRRDRKPDPRQVTEFEKAAVVVKKRHPELEVGRLGTNRFPNGCCCGAREAVAAGTWDPAQLPSDITKQWVMWHASCSQALSQKQQYLRNLLDFVSGNAEQS